MIPPPPVQISGLKMPRGIAIDWVAGNVYWTDSGRDVIEVAQMKGENRKTLISGMIDEPHAIVVDPLRGWAGLGEASGLGRGWGPSTPGALFPPQPGLGLRSSQGPLSAPPRPAYAQDSHGPARRGLMATRLLSWAAGSGLLPGPRGRLCPRS